MRLLSLLTFGLGALLSAQTPDLGIFEGASDVGSSSHKGSVVYNPATKEYRVTGGGNNVWANKDDFYFVWKKVSGDIVLSANVKFAGEGAPHRKTGIMFRKDLETGSPYADVAVHGEGLTAIQWREKADDITRGANYPIELPSQIRLERRGTFIRLFAGKEGGALVEQGSVQFPLGNPLYVGIWACPHDDKAETTVVFSAVTLETPAPAAPPQGAPRKNQKQK